MFVRFVMAEAMAMGLPIVATNILGVPDLVKHNKAGLLIEHGNVDVSVPLHYLQRSSGLCNHQCTEQVLTQHQVFTLMMA